MYHVVVNKFLMLGQFVAKLTRTSIQVVSITEGVAY